MIYTFRKKFNQKEGIDMDAYIADVLSVRGTEEWIATIDFSNGKCWSGATRKDKELAQKDLGEATKKFDVKLVLDPRVTSAALSKAERDWIYECKKQNKDYKDVLLKSRIEKRKLTQQEMVDTLTKELKAENIIKKV